MPKLPNTRFNLTLRKSPLQVKRMLYGRFASVQWAAEHPRVVRRIAPSNTRIKLTTKLKSLTAFSLLAAYPPPIKLTRLWRDKGKYKNDSFTSR